MAKRKQTSYPEDDYDEYYHRRQSERRRTKGRKKRKKKKKLGFFTKLFRVLLLLSVLVIAVSFAWRFYVPTPSQTLSAPASPPSATEESDPIQENPSHYQRKEGFYTFLLVGSDDGHGNADSILVAGLDSKTGEMGLVSVPRDTLVYRTWSNFPKLNAGISKGIETLKNEVSYTLGIPIDFYVHIGLDGFVAVVDQMGGIEYDVPQDMYHDDEGGFVINLKEGYQLLDGRDTLELVRYRGYATADIGRTETQQGVLKALLNKAISWQSFTKFNSFLTIFQEHVDTNLENSDFLWFAKELLENYNNFQLETLTLPGRGDASYNGYTWCYALDPTATLEAVNTHLNPYTTHRTLEDLYLLG